MTYTIKDAYVYGYIAGLIESAARAQHKSIVASTQPMEEACNHPQKGFAKMYMKAFQANLISQELDSKNGNILDEIRIDNDNDFLPTELQGTWIIAYYHAKSGKDFNPPKDDTPEK